MVIKVYISGMSGNKEVKKRQQRVALILDSKQIEYSVIDITESSEAATAEKEFMQTNALQKGSTISDPNPRYPLPPQIFKDEVYCGDYEGFDAANEEDKLEEFLQLRPATSTTTAEAVKDSEAEETAAVAVADDTSENKENKTEDNNGGAANDEPPEPTATEESDQKEEAETGPAEVAKKTEDGESTPETVQEPANTDNSGAIAEEPIQKIETNESDKAVEAETDIASDQEPMLDGDQKEEENAEATREPVGESGANDNSESAAASPPSNEDDKEEQLEAKSATAVESGPAHLEEDLLPRTDSDVTDEDVEDSDDQPDSVVEATKATTDPDDEGPGEDHTANQEPQQMEIEQTEQKDDLQGDSEDDSVVEATKATTGPDDDGPGEDRTANQEPQRTEIEQTEQKDDLQGDSEDDSVVEATMDSTGTEKETQQTELEPNEKEDDTLRNMENDVRDPIPTEPSATSRQSSITDDQDEVVSAEEEKKEEEEDRSMTWTTPTQPEHEPGFLSNADNVEHLSTNGDATMVDADDTEEQELIRASAALAGQSEDAQEEVIEVDDGADVADEPETAEDAISSKLIDTDDPMLAEEEQEE
ncbi:acidic leucine-rich nuclear phosphoprotein 32-related protein-like isoform X2 [Anopheles albimanus]|uniref:acidic leucine-rich nuclear phosphoprotein 32-related protein-like isoform X2 n=1 Tax=Anopheles albimanus TaxID=7167 RepID=UPI0016409848|nr:acidic leucine-rich nuclear phosphoprotein 32-related protein-like isoform X2 [Anopheles albimanus]